MNDKEVRLPDQLLRLVAAQAVQMQSEVDELKHWESFFLGATEGTATEIGRHLSDIQRLCQQKLAEFDGPRNEVGLPAYGSRASEAGY